MFSTRCRHGMRECVRAQIKRHTQHHISEERKPQSSGLIPIHLSGFHFYFHFAATFNMLLLFWNNLPRENKTLTRCPWQDSSQLCGAAHRLTVAHFKWFIFGCCQLLSKLPLDKQILDKTKKYTSLWACAKARRSMLTVCVAHCDALCLAY